MSMGNYLRVRIVYSGVMATKRHSAGMDHPTIVPDQRATVGIDHLTVVPANYSPDE